MKRHLWTVSLIFALGACGTAANDGEGDTGGPVDRTVYPEGPYGAEEGSVVTNHKLITAEGGDFFFGADIRENTDNKVLLISSGAAWCTACIEEQPKLQEFYDEYNSQGLEILEVIFQDIEANPGTAADAQAWIDEFGVSYPVVADGEAQFDQYQDPSLAPLIMLIELDTMTILKKSSGFQESLFEALIQSQL
jgi:thiol-disulfide isomerase/thioredoxin